MNTFPVMTIKTTLYEQTPEIIEYLEKRMQTLEKYLPDGETAIVCDVELEKLTEQQNGSVYRTEVNLKIGGTLLRAEATGETMEEAIDRVKQDMKTKLVRTQGKRMSLIRRGAKRLKDMMRFGG